ncbi:transposase [Streptomyces sp. NPDC056230]|uniref:transposase n=1 Tax=Streptomyces sp. NPDC056230 TaxID=3345754 RepID=UPI0035D545CA
MRRGLRGLVPARRTPGISPAQPATVCVPRFLLGLSDRQAAEAVRCRIDFTCALAMELDDPGLHHSVPADFRERLARDDRADHLFDLALARLKEAGLVRERTTQRTDSTHILAAVRDLARLELVTEVVPAPPEGDAHPPLLAADAVVEAASVRGIGRIAAVDLRALSEDRTRRGSIRPWPTCCALVRPRTRPNAPHRRSPRLCCPVCAVGCRPGRHPRSPRRSPAMCARYAGLGEPPADAFGLGRETSRPGRLAAPARSRHVRRRSPLRPARIQGDQKTLRLTSSHTSLTDESAREHARASDLDHRCTPRTTADQVDIT